MKNLIKLLLSAVMILPVVVFYSCEEKSNDPSGTGLAEFSVSLIQDDGSKGSDSVNTSMHLMISVEDNEGNKIFTDKLIPLYSFGTGFLSENIEIRSGNFRLTKFLVINAAGQVLFATPVTGSEMAYLVNRTLPASFHIEAGQVTRLAPEVLAVNDITPDKFGYAVFGFQVVKPLEFFTHCIIENPLSAAPILVTSAKLTVSAPGGWHYTFKLDEKVNRLLIRGGSEVYNFLVEKEGYLPQTFQFTASQLEGSRPENPITLRIPFNSQLKLIVLQPGPARAVDAMISNLDPEKNFGDHKYFEATFLSEPVLTVMRSNRSLINFSTDTLPGSAVIKKVVLTLSYDIPIPFDNSYLLNTGPIPGAVWYGGVFQKVVEPWEESRVNWNNQPETTETGQVYLSPFIKNANIVDVDVTSLFLQKSEVAVPLYGIMFKLWPVDRFPGFRFASGDYPVAAMRPKLKIYYMLN